MGAKNIVTLDLGNESTTEKNRKSTVVVLGAPQRVSMAPICIVKDTGRDPFFGANVTFNKGQGTGSQGLPYDDLLNVADKLEYYAENGVDGPAAKSQVPSVNMEQTIHMDDDGNFRFQFTRGRGAKPVIIHPDEMVAVAAQLRVLHDKATKLLEMKRALIDAELKK
jgi:hypothetical protein